MAFSYLIGIEHLLIVGTKHLPVSSLPLVIEHPSLIGIELLLYLALSTPTVGIEHPLIVRIEPNLHLCI